MKRTKFFSTNSELTLRFVVFLFLLTLVPFSINAQKREFRGAWIQCVNGQYLGKSMSQIREMLSSQLDVLQSAGINAIMFQVRAEGDALYASRYEPWSRYLTGQQGLMPSDSWDPLAWMVDECHKRDMECHAWINPYRAKTKGTTALASTHPILLYPERIFRYGDLQIFNPALEVNRLHTCVIIEDIISRFDVDGIHMDDYFYPYPEAGQTIPDEADFRRDPRGFSNIDDWRRDNVNLLIKDIHDLVRKVKPWVKFGISPFGIYRNSPNGVNSPQGSATNGLQNYDQLYADITLWTRNGWVDYIIPQVYWNIGNKAADYKVLVNWWNDYCPGRPIFIGQDVERTVKEADPSNPNVHQMDAKYQLQRSLPNIQGSCQWYAAAVVSNPGSYCTLLQTKYHSRPSLQPEMKWIDSSAPKKVSKLKVNFDKKSGGIYLVWKAPKGKKELDKAWQYAVYRYVNGEKIDIDSPDAENHLVAITHDTSYQLKGNQLNTVYVVTALDRLHNESKISKIKL